MSRQNSTICICGVLEISWQWIVIKTNFILFHKMNKPIPPNPNEIVTNNMTINRVKSFQYLGLPLDETLRFSYQVDFQSRPLIKYLGIFNNVKYRITNKLAR